MTRGRAILYGVALLLAAIYAAYTFRPAGSARDRKSVV